MTRKHPPRTTPATKDFKLDRRSPKTPPDETGRRHVDHPVGLQPLGHVVMAGDRHEAAADPLRADAFGNCRRNDPGNVAVHHAGELVERDHLAGVAAAGKGPGQIAAELLPVAQHAVRLDPTRRRGEADRGKEVRDFLNRALAQSVDDCLVGRPLLGPVEAPAEQRPGDGAFAAARGAHDQPDLPGERRGEGRIRFPP